MSHYRRLPNVCVCESCCKAQPWRWDLRKKRGYGIMNGARVDSVTGSKLKGKAPK